MYDSLQQDARGKADRAFTLWVEDMWHPSLDFTKLQGELALWRAKIGDHHRAVCVKYSDRWVWFWIGTHEAYNTEF